MNAAVAASDAENDLQDEGRGRLYFMKALSHASHSNHETCLSVLTISKFKEHESQFGIPKLEGNSYDTTTIPRKQRAEYHFDRKHPLADFATEDVKKNRVKLAGA